ncbi:MAG: response regulator transcription factor [Chitinophagaceae bacterium]|nr:response regulator transcription factor [Chitinophagaceae bacterium]
MTKPIIFIVDDSALMISRFMEMITETTDDHDIRYAGSYREAVRQLDSVRPDLLLLDINLPDGNGISLLRVMRQKYPGIKAVMVSNQADDYYKKLCLSLGAIGFLDKSKDYERLPEFLPTVTAPAA